jgi:hypothetical protein
MHTSVVDLASDWEEGAFVGMLLSENLIDVNAETRFVARIQETVLQHTIKDFSN